LVVSIYPVLTILYSVSPQLQLQNYTHFDDLFCSLRYIISIIINTLGFWLQNFKSVKSRVVFCFTHDKIQAKLN